jgi:nucleoside-diphosphate-sugar epimerase
MKHILLTGDQGYLGMHIQHMIAQKFPDIKIITLSERIEDDFSIFNNIDKLDGIIHLAAIASNFEMYTPEDIEKDIDRNKLIIRLGAKFNIPILYASSEVILDDSDNSIYKHVKEQCLFDYNTLCDKSVIMHIPRVYSADRERGLMPKLLKGKIPEEDLNKEIEFIDIKDFLKIIEDLLLNRIIFDYNEKINFRFTTNWVNKEKLTLREIKEKYEKRNNN